MRLFLFFYKKQVKAMLLEIEVMLLALKALLLAAEVMLLSAEGLPLHAEVMLLQLEAWALKQQGQEGDNQFL
jgi:hypothetical protein